MVTSGLLKLLSPSRYVLYVLYKWAPSTCNKNVINVSGSVTGGNTTFNESLQLETSGHGFWSSGLLSRFLRFFSHPDVNRCFIRALYNLATLTFIYLFFSFKNLKGSKRTEDMRCCKEQTAA